jgi:hypothetical protein
LHEVPVREAPAWGEPTRERGAQGRAAELMFEAVEEELLRRDLNVRPTPPSRVLRPTPPSRVLRSAPPSRVLRSAPPSRVPRRALLAGAS